MSGAGFLLAPFSIPREGVVGFWSWTVLSFFVVVAIAVFVIAVGGRDD